MIKVKFLGSDKWDEFENSINNFIRDKNVIDIKFQSLLAHNGLGGVVADRALIIYEEVEKDETNNQPR